MLDPQDINRRSVEDVLAAHAEDRFERVFADDKLRGTDELFVMWGAARAEANSAFDAWNTVGGPRAYGAYRAAEDRCDAAEMALAAAWAVRRIQS